LRHRAAAVDCRSAPNLSNDPDQEYFADGITDDLTTDLLRISDSFVIARAPPYLQRQSCRCETERA
jgi:TolB-like protein